MAASKSSGFMLFPCVYRGTPEPGRTPNPAGHLGSVEPETASPRVTLASIGTASGAVDASRVYADCPLERALRNTRTDMILGRGCGLCDGADQTKCWDVYSRTSEQPFAAPVCRSLPFG